MILYFRYAIIDCVTFGLMGQIDAKLIKATQHPQRSILLDSTSYLIVIFFALPSNEWLVIFYRIYLLIPNQLPRYQTHFLEDGRK